MYFFYLLSKFGSSTILSVEFRQRSLNQIRPMQELCKCDIFFFNQKMLKYFNDCQNRNFSVLWLKWTQTMKMKQNQALFHGIYSKFDDIHFLIKNIKVFNILSKLKFVSFTNKLNKSIRNEAKSDILLCDIFKSDVIYLLSKNIKVFQWLSKSKFLSFMTKVISNNKHKTK